MLFSLLKIPLGDCIRITQAIEMGKKYELEIESVLSQMPFGDFANTNTSIESCMDKAEDKESMISRVDRDHTFGCKSTASSLSPIPTNSIPALSNDRDDLDLAVLFASPLIIHDERGVSHPLPLLDFEAERRALVAELSVQRAARVRFQYATLENLRTILSDWNCKVLHYSGHGEGASREQNFLCFEDGVGVAHIVRPGLLRDVCIIRGSSKLELVVVSACHSEAAGRSFLEANIPNVIAVHSQTKILDKVARVFAKHLYLALFSGKTIKDAFEIAKSAVKSIPHSKYYTCCCAHTHKSHCEWVKNGSNHNSHSKHNCCCMHRHLAFPHDDSTKFLLLTPSNLPTCVLSIRNLGEKSIVSSTFGNATHNQVLFPDIPRGQLQDITPVLPPSSLPAPPQHFLGRSITMQKVVDSVLKNRVTCITGAPGIGKSVLAISVGHYLHARHHFPDGVFFCDFNGIHLPAIGYSIVSSTGTDINKGRDRTLQDEELLAMLPQRCKISIYLLN